MINFCNMLSSLTVLLASCLFFLQVDCSLLLETFFWPEILGNVCLQEWWLCCTQFRCFYAFHHYMYSLLISISRPSFSGLMNVAWTWSFRRCDSSEKLALRLRSPHSVSSENSCGPITYKYISSKNSVWLPTDAGEPSKPISQQHRPIQPAEEG